jgi:hypothetical protein
MKTIFLILMSVLCVVANDNIDKPKRDRRVLGITLASIGLIGCGSLVANAANHRDETMVYKTVSFRSTGALPPGSPKDEVYKNGWNRETKFLCILSGAISAIGVTFMF